ncbi:hypothetical protein DSCA_30150 [Desulfosarcina alkanivorans]|uniref:Uncharacterized protein n=1 Tax=Desulfosarcina alkanivorans TaxID=571177 RepID=A0A5K7YKZ6_9BACT|nr:hypothetical protein DSCA_30150 [Desulfosarcina alkanivorans]
MGDDGLIFLGMSLLSLCRTAIYLSHDPRCTQPLDIVEAASSRDHDPTAYSRLEAAPTLF